MTASTLRELARSLDTWLFAAFFPLAVASQFVGHRDVVTVSLYVAFVAVCGATAFNIMWHRAARRARANAARVAEQQLIADHAAWMREHEARRARKTA